MSNELELDKSNWTLIKLGDLVQNISNRVDNPSESKYERFVGLQHFESGELKIREWDTTEGLTSSTKHFLPGDILFARRNAYLKRASLVDFEGVCSGDAFVLRENQSKVLPGFVSFVVNSENLWKFANSNAAGTMSKRVKWKDLAKYEFMLPPKAQQSEIAELLWTKDAVVEASRKLKIKTKRARISFFEETHKALEGETVKLNKLLIRKKEKSKKPHKFEKYIGLEHIESGSFTCNEYAPSTEANAQCSVIKQGDLCYSKLRPYLDKAFIADFDAVSSTELLVFDTKRVTKEYILHHFHSHSFLSYISEMGYGTKMPRVNLKLLGDYNVKILKEEDMFVSKLSGFLDAERKIENELYSSKSVLKSLINQIF